MQKFTIFQDKISDFLDEKNNIPQHNENFFGWITNEINTLCWQKQTIFWDQNKFISVKNEPFVLVKITNFTSEN